MVVQPAPYRFSVEEYHRLGEVGFFQEDDRVELLAGEIVEMAPIGSRHAECVRRLTTFFTEQIGRLATVSIQNPVWLANDSEPQPDVALLRPRPGGYPSSHPRPDDVFLLVEVADATVAWDRNRKVPLYAEGGIAEVLLVDLVAGAVQVFRRPDGAAYGDVTTAGPDNLVAPATFPSATIRVADILP